MSQTKLEQIKEFNEKSAEKAKQKEGELEQNKGNVKLEDDKTPQEKVKEKSEEKPKTPEEIEQEKLRLKEQQEEQQRDTLHQLTEATSTLIERINQPVQAAKGWMSSLPTPGGIAAMLIALGFFALVVIPVNDQGRTRAQLFFQTLLGRTHMKYRETTNVGGSVVHGASGDFGVSTATPGHSGPSQNSGYQNNGPSVPVIDITNLDIFGWNS